jgi:hypothetical protein
MIDYCVTCGARLPNPHHALQMYCAEHSKAARREVNRRAATKFRQKERGITEADAAREKKRARNKRYYYSAKGTDTRNKCLARRALAQRTER